MTFSPTIDIGNILALLGMVVTIFWVVAKMTGDIRLLISQVASVKIDVAKFADAITEIARQDERLTAADVRANVLRQNLDAINDRVTQLERRLSGRDERPVRQRNPSQSLD